jgi:hypothetical protein
MDIQSQIDSLRESYQSLVDSVAALETRLSTADTVAAASNPLGSAAGTHLTNSGGVIALGGSSPKLRLFIYDASDKYVGFIGVGADNPPAASALTGQFFNELDIGDPSANYGATTIPLILKLVAGKPMIQGWAVASNVVAFQITTTGAPDAGFLVMFSGAGAGGMTGIGDGVSLDGFGQIKCAGSLSVGTPPSQVVGPRKTGWTAATNTKTRTTFDTTTVTLPVLAAHVGALIDDLIGHGLIGA